MYIWLDSFPLSDGAKRRLIEECESAVQLVQNFARFKPIFSSFKEQDAALFERMQAALSGKEYYQKTVADLQSRKIVPIPVGNPYYPREWEELPDKPLVLYAQGNLDLLKGKKFAVCGSRRTPPAALKLTEKIAEELRLAFTVITGFSDGADVAALTGAIKGGGSAVCLLAGGFSFIPQTDTLLLEKVKERGLFLSPHRPEVPCRTFSYEYRNKLLAALCEGVLVTGADEKSGALISAKYAEKFGKKVFAFPYSPSAAMGVGCNKLIKSGGYLTETAADIFAAFGIKAESEKPRETLSGTEEQVMLVLREGTNLHVAELAEKTGVPIYKLAAILSSLEIKGYVVRVGGNAYAAV